MEVESGDDKKLGGKKLGFTNQSGIIANEMLFPLYAKYLSTQSLPPLRQSGP